MAKPRVGKRWGGPWYGSEILRLRFERGAQRHFPRLQRSICRNSPRAGFTYRINVAVPHYGERRVEILFEKRSPSIPAITVDGPRESPHRYGDGSLCIWYSRDSKEERWIFNDGLLPLIGLIIVHLFREAWWRETGEWLGPEVDHAPVKQQRALG